MLATLGGILALTIGLALLLLPVVVSELSRPRDSAWGAVVLLLGLVLVTSADRLTGAPMLAVLCGGLLIGRLGTEVGQARWRQLSSEEQAALGSRDRWLTSLNQLFTTSAQLLATVLDALGKLNQAVQERRQPKGTTKRWVRQDTAADAASVSGTEIPAAAVEAEGSTADQGTTSVTGGDGESLDPIEPLLTIAGDEEPSSSLAEGTLELAPDRPDEVDAPQASDAPDPGGDVAVTAEAVTAEVDAEPHSTPDQAPGSSNPAEPESVLQPEASAALQSAPDATEELTAEAAVEPDGAVEPLHSIQSFEEIDALLDLPPRGATTEDTPDTRVVSRFPLRPEPIVDVDVEDMPAGDPDRR